MNSNQIFWFSVCGIIALSLLVTFFAPVSDAYRGLAAMPGVAGMAVVLIQLFRDRMAHEQRRELQNEQHLFNLGATSMPRFHAAAESFLRSAIGTV